VNRGTNAQTFCIHAGTYDIGTATLQPRPGQTFIGDPVDVGPNGEILAPTKIKGTSLDGIFYFVRPANGVTIENLDVSGSPATRDKEDPDTKKHGRGLNGNSQKPVLKIRYSRFHHNANSGVDGIGPGTVLERVELDHNGSEGYLGCCAGGVKSGNYYTIRNSYVHHNTGYGIWCDMGCDSGVWTILDNLVTDNTVDGIRYEISMNDFGALVRGNVVRRNNTSKKVGGHGGIAIVSSWKSVVSGNVLGGNGNAGIEFKDDNRGSLANNRAFGNNLNGDLLRGCDALGVACS
jgi:parallel beta-helix repeat protein